MTHGAGGENAPAHARWLAALLGIVAAGLLVLLIVLVQQAITQRDRAMAQTEHSFTVMLSAKQAQTSLARAESALGHFVISSDPRVGTVYYDSWRHAGSELDVLTKLVQDNPVQVARLRRIRALFLQRGRELALPAAHASYRQGWPALSLYYRAGLSPTLPAIGRALRDVTATETKLLDRRASSAAVRADWSNNLTSLLSLVGALLALSVCALAWLVSAMFTDRRIAREDADSEADRASYLEQAVAERTAELSAANLRLEAEAATRIETESKLHQAQKMEAVGQLTGGIAHDFNNMLAVVVGSLEMAKRQMATRPAEAIRHLDGALHGAERAAALTRRLLAFARAQPLLPAAVAPGRLLHGMADLLERTLGGRMEVRLIAETEAWPVWIDAYQLENAILNLAVNGRDAMGGVGTLVMSVANSRLTKGDVGGLAAGDYVRLTVTDTGTGMSAETLERVFEPFFTTKPAGHGTGLGLSQILGFARQSGGDVAIASTPGQGTSVSIVLPRHVGRPAEPAPAREPEGEIAPAGNDGLILLVEDDPRVREAMVDALEELGRHVIAATSGEEALAKLGANPHVALLMTDVIMPGMTGVELVRTVRERQPELPVLFVTGYPGEASGTDGFPDGTVLRKPFTLRALSSALATALPPIAVERAA